MNRIEKEECLMDLLSSVSNKLNQCGDKFLADVTYKQWLLLSLLAQSDVRQQSLNEIATAVGTTRQNVKKMLVPLEKKGFLKMEKSKQDARVLQVELTIAAYQFIIKYDDEMNRQTNRLFDSLDDDALEQLMGLLKQLVKNVK